MTGLRLGSFLVALAALPVAVACSSGEAGPRPTEGGQTTAAVPAGASTGAGSTGENGSSSAVPPKRIWLGRYALWVTDVRVALEKAGTLQHRRGRPVAVAPSEELEQSLAVLRECGTTLAEKLHPPPPAFARSDRLFRRACALFARGAEIDVRVLERRRPALYARAFARWSRAAELIQRANAGLPRPQATERLPLPVGGALVRASRVEPLFTSVASDQAAPAAQVRCWAEPDWTTVKNEAFGRNLDLAGFASANFKRANLDPEICRWLGVLAYTPSRPGGTDQLEIAFALATLMHESGHLNESGDFYGAGRNEPLAECWGMQHIRQAALGLGAGRAYAAELANRYWEEIYPTREPGYRSPRCRNGGAYDVRPGSDVWP